MSHVLCGGAAEQIISVVVVAGALLYLHFS